MSATSIEAAYWRKPFERFCAERSRPASEVQTLAVLCRLLPDSPPPWLDGSWASFLGTEFYLHVSEPLESADGLALVDGFFCWCAEHAFVGKEALADLLDAVDEHRFACVGVRERRPLGAFMEEHELRILGAKFVAEVDLGPFLRAYPQLVQSALSIGWVHLARQGRPGRWDGLNGRAFLRETLDAAPLHDGKLDSSCIDLVRIVAAFIQWLPSPYLDPKEAPRILAPLHAFLLTHPHAA